MIEDLGSTIIQLLHCTTDDGVSLHEGSISQDGELVWLGDLHTEMYQ